MKKRIITHRCNYEMGILLLYRDLKANGLTMDDLDLEEVKTEITDKQELEILEGKCQKLYKPLCNEIIAGRSQKEWYDDNKEIILEKNKEYRQKNKDKIALKEKKYREQNQEKIKKYYDQNRQKIKERTRLYEELNKEKIRERKRLYHLKKKAEQQVIREI